MIKDWKPKTIVSPKHACKMKGYECWRAIVKRCYNKKNQEINKTYVGCKVEKKWHNFTNFNKWYEENYIKGYDLDKDIKVPGNKNYGPKLCIFIPRKINTLFNKNMARRGLLPLGISISYKKYMAYCRYNGKGVYKYFYEKEDAIYFYWCEKLKIVQYYCSEFPELENILNNYFIYYIKSNCPIMDVIKKSF